MLRLLAWDLRREAIGLFAFVVGSSAILALLYFVVTTDKGLRTAWAMHLTFSMMAVLMTHAGFRSAGKDSRLRLLPISARVAGVSRIFVGWSYLASLAATHIIVASLSGRVDPLEAIGSTAAVFVLHAAFLALGYTLSDTAVIWGGKGGIVAPLVILFGVYAPPFAAIYLKVYHSIVPVMTGDPTLFAGAAGVATVLAVIGIYTHVRYEVWVAPPATPFRPSSVEAMRSDVSPLRYLLRSHLHAYRWPYLLQIVFHVGFCFWMQSKSDHPWDFTEPKKIASVAGLIIATTVMGAIVQAIVDGEEPKRCQYSLLPIDLTTLARYRSLIVTNLWMPHAGFWVVWGGVTGNAELAAFVLGVAGVIWILQSAFLFLLDRGLLTPSERFRVFFDVWSPGVNVPPALVLIFGMMAVSSLNRSFFEEMPVVVLILTFGVAILLRYVSIRSYVNRRRYLTG